MATSVRLNALASALLVGVLSTMLLAAPIMLPSAGAMPSSHSAGSPTNELCNSSFEDTTCWLVPSGGAPPPGEYTAIKPRNGSYSAAFCFFETAPPGAACIEAFDQSVVVPGAIGKATLIAHATGDTSDKKNDCSTYAGVALLDPATQEVLASAAICEQGLDGTYHRATETTNTTAALKGRLGQEVLVRVFGRLFDDLESVSGSLLVDDVFLKVEPPVYKRSISLSLKRHLNAKGKLSLINGGPEACSKQVRVRIQKKIGNKWRTVASDTTNSDGGYSEGLTDKTAKYRAVAPMTKLSDTSICAKAVSMVRTHTH